MATIITIEGIDRAIAALRYRTPESLKHKLLQAVRGLYTDEDSVVSLEGIDPEYLIQCLWDVDDAPDSIKSKRKNLSSVKSAVNRDLKAAYKDGRNPDGVILGRNNLFVMSDEAKDELLSSVPRGEQEQAASLRQIAESLGAVEKALANTPDPSSIGDSLDPDTLNDLRQVLQALTEKIGTGKAGLDGSASSHRGADSAEAAEEGNAGPDVGEGQEAGIGPLPDMDDSFEEEGEVPEALDDELEIVEVAEPEADALVDPDHEGAGPSEPPSDFDGGGTGNASEVESPVQGSEEGTAVADSPPEETEAPPADIEPADDLLEEVEDDEIVEVTDDGTDPGTSSPGESSLEDPDGTLGAEDDPAPSTSDTLQEEPPDTVPADEMEAEDPEPVEDLDADEVLEVVDESDTAAEVDDMNDVGTSAGEVGLPEDSFGAEVDAEDPTERSRLLAEAFDGYLGAMERYYNHYLLVPEGSYLIGGTGQNGAERPQVRIDLPAFYMGKFPVTNALFEIFVERTGYVTVAEEQGYSTVYYGRLCREEDKATGRVKYRSTATVRALTVPGACWYHPTGPGSTLHRKRNHPVVHIAFKDAMAFAAWTGKRLPTEDEWEAAARTQRSYLYPWGNEWKEKVCNTEETANADTTPVDAFHRSENELGIVDTLGNVLEWTTDRCPSASGMKSQSRNHRLKGGSWISQRGISLPARFKMDPHATSNIVGFRCAVD